MKNRLTNPLYLAILWIGMVLVRTFLKSIDNNYFIFSHSFKHAVDGLSLYAEYPKEYGDLFLYGIPFTAVIAPFAILPPLLGSMLWCLANVMLLFFAIKQLGLERWKFAFVILFCTNELFTSLIAQQYNIAVAGMIILSFALIEKKKDFWAALLIMFGTMTKLYGIVGLAFFFFSKRKWVLIGGLLFWGIFLFLLPMIYSSPEYVMNSYREWAEILLYKNSMNAFCDYTNISFLGMVRKISQAAQYSDLWLIIPGLILFATPYLRINQYQYNRFRLHFLSSVLLFMTLFSTGTENWGYIGCIAGVGIWYVNTPTKNKTPILNNILLIFCFILTSLSPTDIFPTSVYRSLVVPYALKALPCTLIWFKIIWEQLTQDFSPEANPQ